MVPPCSGRSRRLQAREDSRTVGFGHVADLIPAGSFTRTGASPNWRHRGNDQSPVARATRLHGRSLLLTTHFSGGRSVLWEGIARAPRLDCKNWIRTATLTAALSEMSRLNCHDRPAPRAHHKEGSTWGATPREAGIASGTLPGT